MRILADIAGNLSTADTGPLVLAMDGAVVGRFEEWFGIARSHFLKGIQVGDEFAVLLWSRFVAVGEKFIKATVD